MSKTQHMYALDDPSKFDSTTTRKLPNGVSLILGHQGAGTLKNKSTSKQATQAMAHIGDRPLVVSFLGQGRGKLTDADVKRIMAAAPSMHVLSQGSRSESKGMMAGVSPATTKALHAAARMALNKGALSGGDIAKANKYIATRSHAARKKLLSGAGFWDWAKRIGSFALKALPIIAKVAPIIAGALA